MMQDAKKIDALLDLRMGMVALTGTNIFNGEDGQLGLVRGDEVFIDGEFRGFCRREIFPPLWELANDRVNYIRAYWLHEWRGTFNEAHQTMRTRANDLLDKIGVPKRYQKRTAWDDFEIETEADRTARVQVDTFSIYGDGDRDVLALVGKPGTRKTQLAVIWLWDWVTNYGDEAKFVRAADLTADIRDPEKWKAYTVIDCLVLDDVGADPDDVDAVIKVIGARLDNNLKTVYTSNAWPEQISEIYGPRGHSRMINSAEVVAFGGRDWRLPKPSN